MLMIKKTEIIERGKSEDIMWNMDFLRFLWGGIDREGPYEVFRKQAEDFGPVNLEFILHPEISDDKIARIENVHFLSQAAKQMNDYRVIGRDVYKKLDTTVGYEELDNVGNYIFAAKGEPLFYISVKDSKWRFNPIIVNNFENDDTLSHIPNNFGDSKNIPTQVAIDVVADKKESILYGIYEKLVDFYSVQK